MDVWRACRLKGSDEAAAVSRILFVMLHPGFVRYYDGALEALAAAGHDVHVAFEINRAKLGEDVTAQRLATVSPRITCGEAPSRSESVRTFLSRSDRTATRSGSTVRSIRRWRDPETRIEAQESLATTVRLLVDYLRYFEPAFAGAPALRARAEKRLPRVYPPAIRWVARLGSAARSTLRRLLLKVEETLVPHASIEAFVREQRPDLLLVTPLVELGSQQVDYVKCARRLGVRSALCVASWDNLTSKGLMRIAPDHVVVWNDAQKDEAVRLHGLRADQVMVTGAQLFDRWFAAAPSRTREEFCARVGLDPARPFVLYVGSSMFIAPDEVPFVERWLAAVRSNDDGSGTALGALVRPHPANVEQWRAFDAAAHDNVAVWPPIGTTPNDPDFRRDFFDSLYHSAAVVGINTSAQIEAAIVGRPVLTIHSAEFAHAQEGTLHFQHLVGGSTGFVRESRSLPEHITQLRAVVADPAPAADCDRRFVESFIRPRGLDVAAVPVFVEAIGSLTALPPPPPVRASWLPRAARVPLSGAAWATHLLAEDRPLWVYALRPCLSAAIWIASVPFRAGAVWHEVGYPRVKRGARATHRAWYESRRTIAKLARRAKRPILAVVRGAARRLAGRNA
jgi:hypothetical protein